MIHSADRHSHCCFAGTALSTLFIAVLWQNFSQSCSTPRVSPLSVAPPSIPPFILSPAPQSIIIQEKCEHTIEIDLRHNKKYTQHSHLTHFMLSCTSHTNNERCSVLKWQNTIFEQTIFIYTVSLFLTLLNELLLIHFISCQNTCKLFLPILNNNSHTLNLLFFNNNKIYLFLGTQRVTYANVELQLWFTKRNCLLMGKFFYFILVHAIFSCWAYRHTFGIDPTQCFVNDAPVHGLLNEGFSLL